MANYTTDADILEYEPTIKEFGVIDFSDYHSKTTADIQRHLRIEWWVRVRRAKDIGRYFASTGLEMDTTRLTDSQFKRTAVFHCLAYYILPQLTQHMPDPDRFRMMIDFYKARFREEFDLVLQDGVEYDWDNDGVVEDDEKQTQHYNRLVR
jgi:hypothetical protein